MFIYRNINLKILLDKKLSNKELRYKRILNFLYNKCENLKKYKITWDNDIILYGISKEKIYIEHDSYNNEIIISDYHVIEELEKEISENLLYHTADIKIYKEVIKIAQHFLLKKFKISVKSNNISFFNTGGYINRDMAFKLIK